MQINTCTKKELASSCLTRPLFSGSLTIADLYAVLYPTASVAVINVTGVALLQALETSVARYEMAVTEDLTEFLQVSGKP